MLQSGAIADVMANEQSIWYMNWEGNSHQDIGRELQLQLPSLPEMELQTQFPTIWEVGSEIPTTSIREASPQAVDTATDLFFSQYKASLMPSQLVYGNDHYC